MNVASIYKLTNLVNNKVYIGYTKKNPNIRLQEHYIQSSIGSKATSNRLLYSAIRKHGINNFYFEVIYQSKDFKHCLSIAEAFFIKEYKSHYIEGHGYNMTYGGQGNLGYKFTEEHKSKLSKAQLGKVIKEESRIKMKLADRTKTSKYWKLTKDGSSVIICNLAKWARDNGTRKQALLRVAWGYRNHWHGWKIEKYNITTAK